MRKQDFVAILGSLSNFIANERVEAYNEAIDMMLTNTREWMRDKGIATEAKDLPELLYEIEAHFTAGKTGSD